MSEQTDEDQIYQDPSAYAMRCDCPTCGSPAGSPCLGIDGRHRFAPHSLRFHAEPKLPLRASVIMRDGQALIFRWTRAVRNRLGDGNPHTVELRVDKMRATDKAPDDRQLSDIDTLAWYVDGKRVGRPIRVDSSALAVEPEGGAPT